MKTKRAKIYFTVQLRGNVETKPTPPAYFELYTQPVIDYLNVYQEIKKGEVILIKQIPIQEIKPIIKRRKKSNDLGKAQSVTRWIKNKLGL